jgi:hypothetical protein
VSQSPWINTMVGAGSEGSVWVGISVVICFLLSVWLDAGQCCGKLMRAS